MKKISAYQLMKMRKMLFGQAFSPASVKNDPKALEFVRDNKGAIGYIDSETLGYGKEN